MNILTALMYVIYSPCTPLGRRNRIKHLQEDTGEQRDFCAAVVYSRDSARHMGFTFTDAEKEDAVRIASLLEQGRIRCPSEREYKADWQK